MKTYPLLRYCVLYIV